MDASENSDDSAIAQTDIATDGDVIFVVGPQKKKMRVCSVILSNASACFRTMFGPHFAEGKNLKSNDPKEIPMRDDDADALEILCNVIHLRNDAVPQSLSPTDVFGVAVAADKFGCAVALKYASTVWLNPKGVKEISDLCYLMIAAYILDNPQAFSDITLAMIFSHVGSYLSLADQIIDQLDYMPWKVFYLLEEQRNLIRIELQQLLFQGSFYAGTDDRRCTCGWGSCHNLAYNELLRERHLEPSQISTGKVSQVLQQLEEMPDPTMPYEWEPCDYRYHKKPRYRESRALRLREIQEGNGLCIDCFRSSTTAEDQVHRIKH
ncbi:btb poz domain-containing protein [Pyrenophora tritici-repentis]|nr:btb poz domain-containing protein [Pyrenophora tritici-repentis]